jgi:hypothetical protein
LIWAEPPKPVHMAIGGTYTSPVLIRDVSMLQRKVNLLLKLGWELIVTVHQVRVTIRRLN